MIQDHPFRKVPKTLWPELLVVIAEVIGDEAATLLFIHFNGSRFKVPSQCNKDHAIAKAIGLDKANLLCKRFMRECLTIPKCSVVLKKIRNRAIVADWKHGLTQQYLARKYDLSYRQISSIVSDSKEQTEC